MDLLSIIQTLWRYKKITIPVLIVTMIGALYVVKIKPPVYEAQASILLTNPPGQATSLQIAQNPSLKYTPPYNTYAAYGSLDVVANTIMDIVQSPAEQPALATAGAGPHYLLTLSTAYGDPPIIEVTGTGPSPQAAITSAEAVVKGLKSSLFQLQQSKDVNAFYMITAVDIVTPTQASKSSSGNLRSLVGVLAGGVILLFIGISVLDALERRRVTDSGRPRSEWRGKPLRAGTEDSEWPDPVRAYPGDETEMPDPGRSYRDRGYYPDETAARPGANSRGVDDRRPVSSRGVDDRRSVSGPRPEGTGRDGDGSASRREQSWGHRPWRSRDRSGSAQ